MVRPDGLFALRAHPFGVALRAINFACGEVVEPPCCLSGVRTKTSNGRCRPSVLNSRESGAPGEIIRPSASPLRGRPAGDQLGRRRPSCRTRLFCLSGVRIAADELVDPRGILVQKNNGAPGEIIRPSASPLRGRPAGDQLGRGRPSCRTRLFCLSGVRIAADELVDPHGILVQKKQWCARRDSNSRLTICII